MAMDSTNKASKINGMGSGDQIAQSIRKEHHAPSSNYSPSCSHSGDVNEQRGKKTYDFRSKKNHLENKFFDCMFL